MTDLIVKGEVLKVQNVTAYDNEAETQLGKLVKALLSTGTLRITKIEEVKGKRSHDVLVIEAQ